MLNIAKKIKQKFCKHEKELVTLTIHGDGTLEEVRTCDKCGRQTTKTLGLE